MPSHRPDGFRRHALAERGRRARARRFRCRAGRSDGVPIIAERRPVRGIRVASSPVPTPASHIRSATHGWRGGARRWARRGSGSRRTPGSWWGSCSSRRRSPWAPAPSSDSSSSRGRRSSAGSARRSAWRRPSASSSTASPRRCRGGGPTGSGREPSSRRASPCSARVPWRSRRSSRSGRPTSSSASSSWSEWAGHRARPPRSPWRAGSPGAAAWRSAWWPPGPPPGSSSSSRSWRSCSRPWDGAWPASSLAPGSWWWRSRWSWPS